VVVYPITGSKIVVIRGSVEGVKRYFRGIILYGIGDSKTAQN